MGIEDALTELINCLWPAQCPGCGTWDDVLCPGCAARAEGPAILSTLELLPAPATPPTPGDAAPPPRHADTRAHGPAHVPMARLGDYEDPLRGILLSAKHSRAFRGEDFFHRGGLTLGRALATVLTEPASTHGTRRGPGPEAGREWWVVPAPSSWKRRLLATSPTAPLALGVAEGLRLATGERVRVVEAAGLKIGARSQAGQGAAGRRRGREGSMRRLVDNPDPGRIVLVDDVSTTGATLRELARTMGGCAGACVVAAVAPPSL